MSKIAAILVLGALLGVPVGVSGQPGDPLCGPKSLLVLCDLFGVKADLDELIELSESDPEKGTTMYGLYLAAQKKGLYPQGLKLSLDALRR